jgi:hypothetical protein
MTYMGVARAVHVVCVVAWQYCESRTWLRYVEAHVEIRSAGFGNYACSRFWGFRKSVPFVIPPK